MKRGEKHTVKGELLTQSEAAKAYGWGQSTISRRMKEGMSLEEAVNVDRNPPPPPPKTEKVCARCRVDKPVAEYGLRNKSGARYSYCKPCKRNHQREWAQRHKEREDARTRNYYLKHKERIAAQMRDYNLRRNYGINSRQYEDMLKQQGGVCLGCGDAGAIGKRLAVDHCHGSGKVRGLLCALCNLALGALKDNPATLRRLADYLEGAEVPISAQEKNHTPKNTHTNNQHPQPKSL